MVSEDLIFRAIAHPVRREIIGLLAISSLSVKDLTAKFEISQPAVSQHLKELKDASLVASERIGLEQHYSLTPQPLRHVVKWSERYRPLIDPSGHHWTLVSGGGERGKQPQTRNKGRDGD